MHTYGCFGCCLYFLVALLSIGSRHSSTRSLYSAPALADFPSHYGKRRDVGANARKGCPRYSEYPMHVRLAGCRRWHFRAVAKSWADVLET